MATITHAREAVVQTLYALEQGNDKAVDQFDELLKEKKIKNKKAEFAKNFSEDKAKSFINGILDRVAKEIRE